MGGVENDVTFDHRLYTGTDSKSFGGGNVMLNRLNVNSMQRRVDLEMGVNKPFENVSCQGPIQHFFRERAPIFVTFSSVVFLAQLVLSNLCIKNDSRRVR